MIRSRNGIVFLLTALNLVNYLDRFLVMAVGPRIREEFGWSDAKLGIVEIAFMVGYMLTSPIFGALGDRYPRKHLIAAGVAIWSIATVLSGTTGSFATMVAARIVVGVGEASYATLSPTIVDDLATSGNRNRMLAIFYGAIPVGSALGYVLGGILEPRFGWRSAFFICGGPGVLLAAMTLLIAEPARSVESSPAPGTSAGVYREPSPPPAASGGVYRELWQRPQYRFAVAGYIAQTFALGGFTAWAAPLLSRHLCLELATGNQVFGYVTVVTGLVGTAAGGILADRVPGANRAAAALRVCAWSSAIATPIAFAFLLMPNAVTAFVALGVCELAIFASVSPTNAAVLGSVPVALRANAMAASIFAIHLLGDLVASPAIGAISDGYGDAKEFCSGGQGLRAGMMLLPLALALSAAFWFRGSRVAVSSEARAS
jgi:MFS family permease